MKVSIGKGNEILVNGRTSEERDDNTYYVCDVCGDITDYVGYTVLNGVEVHSCIVCDEVVEKCTDCSYLVENKHEQWACEHFGKICAECVQECEM